MPAITQIPNRTGNGTIWFRADHELVGRTLAEKLRLRAEQRGLGDSFRIARPKRARGEVG
jgi:hypothetical protein